MADPLTQVAEQYAPAPLNFFDAGRAQSIIARHADSRRGLDASNEAVKAAGQLYDLNRSQDREARDKILQSRQDQEWNDREDARLQRGAFISDMVTDLDHNDPDYNKKVIEFVSKVPPTVQEDPVFKDILSFKNREADKAEMERRRLNEIEERHKNSLELARERAKSSELFSHLKEDDWKAAPRDEKGDVDVFWLATKAQDRKREAGVDDYGKKTEIRKNAAKELLDVKKMDADQKALYHETRDILASDKDAFPDRLEGIRKIAESKGLNLLDKDLKDHPDFAEEYRKAEAWDKDKFRNEVNTAKKYKTPEEYIPFNGPDGKPVALSENAVAARRRLWEYAHQNDGITGEAPATPKPVAPKSAPAKPAGPIKGKDDAGEFLEATINGRVVRKYSDGRLLDVTPEKK